MMNSGDLQKTYVINGYEFEAHSIASGLHVVATPLGNLADVSLRCLSVLAAADRVLCEDTRVTRKLMQRYAISTKLQPYHDHNASSARPAILEDLKGGAAIALVSDAGMPMVNDPGYKLVHACVAQDIAVDVIPGPTAPITALALSGLPTDRFMFAGFLPAKSNARLKELRELAGIRTTLLFFESANRIEASLAAISEVLGNRSIAVAREITKLHQEVIRGNAQDVLWKLSERAPLKGEITIVIGPPGGAADISEIDMSAQLTELLKNHSPSKAATLLARQTGKPKSDIYDLAVTMKADKR